MRVVPEGAGVRRREGVLEALARLDRLLREVRHAIHRVWQTNAVPVNCRVLCESVLDGRSEGCPLPDTQDRTRLSAVVGPHLGLRRAITDHRDARLARLHRRGETVTPGWAVVGKNGPG